MHKTIFLAGIALAAATLHGAVRADSTEARCDIYPAGEDHTDVMIPCRFYQAQGHVVITRSDGVEHDLTPNGERQPYEPNVDLDFDAANREVEARLEGDWWTVIVDGEDEYRVNRALIEGG